MKTLIASAVLALFAATATASGGFDVSASGVAGKASAASGSIAGAASNGNGGSYSFAANKTTAAVSGSSYDYANAGRHTVSGAAGVEGAAATSSESVALNKSFGNANGNAAAGGIAKAEVAGGGLYIAAGRPGATGGIVGGTASSQTTQGVLATRNEFGVAGAGTVSGFEADAASSVTKHHNSVSMVDQTSAEAGSLSGKGSFGNASIYNQTSGNAGAVAVTGSTGSFVSRGGYPSAR
jgi:hypothetical protein